MDEPIKTYVSYDLVNYEPRIKKRNNIEFQVNDFYDRSDILGLIEYDIEPYSYFSKESTNKEIG